MNTLEHMKERFDLLPADFQEAIRTFEYDKKLNEVSKKFKLHIDQLVVLEKAMSDIIFGGLRASDLISTLSAGLRISSQEAREIAADLNSSILLPLKFHIKDVQELNDLLAHPKAPDTEGGLREVL